MLVVSECSLALFPFMGTKDGQGRAWVAEPMFTMVKSSGAIGPVFGRGR